MSILDESVAQRDVELALNLAESLARARFFYYGSPEYLEALFRTRAHLGAMSSDSEDPQRHLIAQSLALLEKVRLTEYFVTVNPQAADANNIGVSNHGSLFHLGPFPINISDNGKFSTATQDEKDQDSHILGPGSLLGNPRY